MCLRVWTFVAQRLLRGRGTTNDSQSECAMKRFSIGCLVLLGLLHLFGANGVAMSAACGDIVTGWVTLTDDLACPSGHGLVLASGAALDCAGHLVGGGGQAQQYGIYVRDADDALVENCVVENFEVGIRVSSAARAVVQGNISRNNTRYGMEVTRSSVAALIQRNLIQGNGDEGLHISGPTDVDANHQVRDNTVDANMNEGIYLFQSSGNLIADNMIQDQGAAGIYVKQSYRNVLTGNTLIDNVLQLVSGSGQNVLSDNTIIGQAIKFSQSSNNQVYNLSVQASEGRPGVAYVFISSSNNVIVDSEAVDLSGDDVKATRSSKNNVFTRFAAPSPLSCLVDRTSSVSVTDENGQAVPCGK
jgi:parallel beta-helix repeat protein